MIVLSRLGVWKSLAVAACGAVLVAAGVLCWPRSSPAEELFAASPRPPTLAAVSAPPGRPSARPTSSEPAPGVPAPTTAESLSKPKGGSKPPSDVQQALRLQAADAPAGRPLLRGDRVVVDQITGKGPSGVSVTLTRLMITGRVPDGDNRLAVSVDGLLLGYGVESPDLTKVTVLVSDSARLSPGREVTYRYGDVGSPVSAGRLHII
jgi:hypothetical protein